MSSWTSITASITVAVAVALAVCVGVTDGDAPPLSVRDGEPVFEGAREDDAPDGVDDDVAASVRVVVGLTVPV